MAEITLDDVVSMVPKRYETLEKKGRIGFFPPNQLFKKIINNPVAGGGASCVIPITVDAPDFQESGSSLIQIRDDIKDVTIDLNFPYRVIEGEFTLTQSAIAKIANAPKSVRNYLDKRIENGVEGYRNKMEERGFNGTGATTTFLGFKSFWYGATYGGVVRADETPTNSKFDVVLGNNVAYVYGSGTPPTRAQTHWDASEHMSAIEDPKERQEEQRRIIRELLLHIELWKGEKPDELWTGGGLYADQTDLIDRIANPASMGFTKSVTASGDEQLKFSGQNFSQTRVLDSGELLALSTKYIFTPGVEGFDLHSPYREIEVSSKYKAAKRCDIIGEGSIVTDCVTAHGWVKGLTEPFVVGG
jgi:hypothetical protein